MPSPVRSLTPNTGGTNSDNCTMRWVVLVPFSRWDNGGSGRTDMSIDQSVPASKEQTWDLDPSLSDSSACLVP